MSNPTETTTTETLEERLTEYRDSVLALQRVAQRAFGIMSEAGIDAESLQDLATAYTLIAADLTLILNGEPVQYTKFGGDEE